MFVMQRGFLWLSALLALYVSGFACATTEPQSPGNEYPEPHIALLLPLKSTIFNSAAEAVLQGFQAAANLEARGPVRPGDVQPLCHEEPHDRRRRLRDD